MCNYKLSSEWNRQDSLLYCGIGALVTFFIVDELALSLIPDIVTENWEGYSSLSVSAGVKEVCSG